MATLPMNQLKGKPLTAVCPILNVHRCIRFNKIGIIYQDIITNIIMSVLNRLLGNVDKFFVFDKDVKQGEIPDGKKMFHTFTYKPAESTLKAANPKTPWFAESHEKSMTRGDVFKARVTNVIDPKVMTNIIELPNCKFVHVIFCNEQIGKDKTHKDIAITFDILFENDTDGQKKKLFLEANGPDKFQYLSFAIVSGTFTSKKIIQRYGVITEEVDGTLRINDLLISTDKGITGIGALKRDDAFINSLIEHHIDTGKPAGESVTTAAKEVTGRDVNKSLSNLGESASNAVTSAAGLKTTGGKSRQKRKTQRKKSINKQKKRRKSRRHRKKL